jgi:hypothetical protein
MADDKTPEKTAPKTAVARAQAPAPEPAPEPLVFLYLGQPHTSFELSGMGLADLVPEGTAYSPKDADMVRMMCLKYGIRYSEGE